MDHDTDFNMTSPITYEQVIEHIVCETSSDFAYYSSVEAPKSVTLAAFMFNKSIEEVIYDCKLMYDMEE